MERGGKKLKKRHRMKNPGLEPTPVDMEIAKYLRFKVPRKSTMIQKQQVEYFAGDKAVDFLMDSKWATRKKSHDQLFVVRDDATNYLNELLQKKFFYRAMKTEKESKKKGKVEEEKDSDKNQSQNEKEETKENSDTKIRRRKTKKTTEVEEEGGEDSETNKKGKTKNSKKSKDKKAKEKVKKRYKLSHHDEQVFHDSKDIYIWLYNPVSWKTIAMGIGVLLCVVAGTLFPLWPPEVRTGVYYLSVTGGVFIGFIFAIALARTILYGVIWLFTGGKHHLWILPNILADVGFFESFQPWYTYEYKGSKEEEEDNDDDDDEKDVNEGDEEDEVKQNSDNDTKVDTLGQEDQRNSQDESDSEQKEDSQSQNSSEASEEESHSR